jgi:hypothetical protein
VTIAPPAPTDTEGSGAGAWLWPLLFLAAYAALLAWKQQHAFAGLVPLGDHAADDILIVEAKRFALLHGVYSRFAFYHPGPLVLQITALGELILFDALRWLSSYYLAQVFATALLHGIAFALVLRLWLIVTGNILVALLAVAAVMATISRGGSPDILLKYWLAHSTVAGATLLATGFAGLLLRGPSWLPLLAFGAVLLINAHVGFVSIVPALVIAVTLAAIMARRLPFSVFDGTAILRYAARHRVPIALGAAIMALGLMPIVINLIANWPAELPGYLATARILRMNDPLDVLRVIVRFVPLYGVWMLVFLSWVRPASENRAQADIRIVGVTLFWTALAVAFVFSLRGIDSPDIHHVFYWLTGFVGMAAAAAVVYAWSVWRHRLARTAIAIGVIALVAIPIARAMRLPVPSDTRPVVAAADLLAGRAGPGGKSIVVLDTNPESWDRVWTRTVGILAVLNRRNDRSVCIARESWTLPFHARYRCPTEGHPDDIVLHLLARERAAGTELASLHDVVIVKLDNTAR